MFENLAIQVLIIALACIGIISIVSGMIMGIGYIRTKKKKVLADTIDSIESEYIEKVQEIQTEYQNSMDSISYTPLSVDDVNMIIADVIEELWNNKYLVAYRLKNAKVIANMDDEIREFSKEVYSALSANVIHNAKKYYSYNYMIERITRQATVLLFDYTKKYNSSSK